jgi:hypothetical protein
LAERNKRAIQIADKCGFGYLEFKATRRQSGLEQYFVQLAGELFSVSLQ